MLKTHILIEFKDFLKFKTIRVDELQEKLTDTLELQDYRTLTPNRSSD